MKHTTILYILLGLEVLMLPIVYWWNVVNNLSFFDFGTFALYISIPLLFAALIYSIRIKSWILICSTIITGILVVRADAVTESYVRYQDEDNQFRAIMIMEDVYHYYEQNGIWPDRLSQATHIDTQFHLGLNSSQFRYTKTDSTFEFQFPAKNDAVWYWHHESHQLMWHD